MKNLLANVPTFPILEKEKEDDEEKHLRNGDVYRLGYRDRYGRLTVQRYAGKDRHGNRLYQCTCVCGTEVHRTLADLKIKRKQTCGPCRDEFVERVLDRKQESRRKDRERRETQVR